MELLVKAKANLKTLLEKKGDNAKSYFESTYSPMLFLYDLEVPYRV
jgi:hypothetical protein